VGGVTVAGDQGAAVTDDLREGSEPIELQLPDSIGVVEWVRIRTKGIGCSVTIPAYGTNQRSAIGLRQLRQTSRLSFGWKECLYNPSMRRGAERVILVVEADPELRTLYRTTLRSAGYAVFAVDDGIDALEYVEQTHPAAVVLDLGLPRLNGRDVQREMAAKPDTQRIPIIVVTGQTENIDHRDFACVLHKPVGPDALITAVHECLNKLRR
jgi:twitching motility two-component system response regulator PilH